MQALYKSELEMICYFLFCKHVTRDMVSSFVCHSQRTNQMGFFLDEVFVISEDLYPW